MAPIITNKNIKINKYSHLKHFDAREDIIKGDSVLIIRDGDIFCGFYLDASVERNIWRLNYEVPVSSNRYNRYNLIYIVKNFKRLCISRYEKNKESFKYNCKNNDLEIYRTRVVIFEKCKPIYRHTPILWR